MAKRDLVVPGIEGVGDLPCKELVVESASGAQYFLYTYKCGGTYTRSFWRQQFTIFLNGLLDRDPSGALIRVSTTVETDIEDARRRAEKFLRVTIPSLHKALTSSR